MQSESSVTINGTGAQIPARATYEQIVEAAGKRGLMTVLVRGKGVSRTLTLGESADIPDGATISAVDTSNA
ncbi:MAG: hypothetical protein RID81_07050 [Sandaracinaceae bacterium]